MFEQILRLQLGLNTVIDTGKWKIEYWKIKVITFTVECFLGRKSMHYTSTFFSRLTHMCLCQSITPLFYFNLLSSMFNFNKITLLFHLFFPLPLFVVFVSIYPYNRVVRTACICCPYVLLLYNTYIHRPTFYGTEAKKEGDSNSVTRAPVDEL